MHRRRSPAEFVPLFTALLLVVSTSCAPMLELNRRLPPPVDLGADRTVAIEVAAGPRSQSTVDVLSGVAGIFTGESIDTRAPLEALQSRFPARLDATRFFTLGAMPEAALLLRLSVTDWRTKVWDIDGTRKLEASLSANLVASRTKDGVIIATRDYLATASTPVPEGRVSPYEAELLAKAVEGLCDQLIFELTPSTDGRMVALEEAPEVKEVLATIKAGRLVEARQALEALLTQYPHSTAVLFDLGLLLEGESDHPAARQLYTRALAIEPRQRYRDALRRVGTLRKLQ